MVPSCIFCKIISREIPAEIVYDDETCVAFKDISPQAPVHLLVIPRQHFASVKEIEGSDEKLLGHIHRVASLLAQENDIGGGYRVVANDGPAAGQTVFHFHLHVLGGRQFHWPPG